MNVVKLDVSPPLSGGIYLFFAEIIAMIDTISIILQHWKENFHYTISCQYCFHTTIPDYHVPDLTFTPA